MVLYKKRGNPPAFSPLRCKYYQVYNDYMESGVAPKALFNAARIYMQQGNTQLAQATFAQVADYYPSSEYGMLAASLANVL